MGFRHNSAKLDRWARRFRLSAGDLTFLAPDVVTCLDSASHDRHGRHPRLLRPASRRCSQRSNCKRRITSSCWATWSTGVLTVAVYQSVAGIARHHANWSRSWAITSKCCWTCRWTMMPRQNWLGFGGAQTLDSYGTGFVIGRGVRSTRRFIRTWRRLPRSRSTLLLRMAITCPLPLAVAALGNHFAGNRCMSASPGHTISGKTAVLGHTANKRGKSSTWGT